MVLILDGNSEIGTQVWSDFGYSICLRHLFRPGTVTNLIFFIRLQRVLKRLVLVLFDLFKAFV